MADKTRSDAAGTRPWPAGTPASRDADTVPAEPPAPRLEELPPAAQRALAEAEERRRIAAEAEATAAAARPKELGGQAGPDPIRYGDWEKGGIVSDF